jgi:hypothetical protein
VKIVYQYLINPKVNDWLERKHREYKHRTLSDTINHILGANMTIEAMNKPFEKKENKRKADKPKTAKGAISRLEEKYGVQGYHD